MAKVTIVVEDVLGNVKITADPTFEQMANMINSGSGDDTAAHAYALRMLREARQVSKEIGPIKIMIPRIGR